jgi:hypothetical protein
LSLLFFLARGIPEGIAPQMHVEVVPAVEMRRIPIAVGMSAVTGGVPVHSISGDLRVAALVANRKLELEFEIVEPDWLLTYRAGSAAATAAPHANWGTVRELASFDGLADPLP